MLAGMLRLAAFLCVFLLAGVARAETPRPPGWTAGGDDRAQELVDGLRKLVDDADRTRAASPRFLEELRKLARRHDKPWRVEVLYDDFGDGEYATNPAWTVAAGRFAVEWGYGLRSVVLPAAAQPAAQPAPAAKSEKFRPEDFAATLLKGFLQPKQQQAAPPPPPAPVTKAEIFTPRKLANAFEIRLELSSRSSVGRIEFGPYRGAARTTGYRLVYLPGAKPGLRLERSSQWGAGIIDAYDGPLNLEDGKPHRLDWTRGEDGAMTVSVDGKQVIAVTDRGFGDPFDGFVLINGGGDFGLHRILINGAR